MKRNILLFIFLMGGALGVQGQSKRLDKISTNDSVKINTNIERFYVWYADMIKRNRLNKEFNPVFIKDKDGMTTLDFTMYKAGLRKHDFSDDFIERRIDNYTPCLNNLKQIPYDTFVTFEDTEQFEQINCDFANVHEWTKSMEPHDGAELVTLHKIDKNTIESTIRFYNKTKDGVRHYWGSASLSFKKFKTGWKINNLL